MILDVLWAARTDIALALLGMAAVAVGIVIELSEHRRLRRMARDAQGGRA